MGREMMNPVLLSCCFLALFAVAEFLYHKLNVKPEWTRKIVHIVTGLITLSFPVLLDSHWQVLFLCGSFLIILLVSLRLKLLPSINGIDRVSYGSVLYPIVVYSCFLIYVLVQKGAIMFYLPILILAVCDPVAAFVGRKYPLGVYLIGGDKKTLSGSFSFFVTALLITACTFYTFEIPPRVFWNSTAFIILIPVVATVSEAISVKGTDNFTIPAGVVLTLNLIL